MRTFGEKQNPARPRTPTINPKGTWLSPVESRQANPTVEGQATHPTTLTIGTPGDRYEREAEHNAEQLTTVSDQQFRRPCACGGGCPRCQANQTPTAHEALQPGVSQSSGVGQTGATPIVQQVLASPGHALDLSTRSFMEQRFRYDFSDVRVHSDDRAAEAADAVDADAFTIGSNIVFDAGKYAPDTTVGRALLAHELTHVTQRESAHVLRRRPRARTKEQKRDAWLQKMAEQPGDAHDKWRRLKTMERVAVIVQMTKLYGYDFAKKFSWYTEHPVATFDQHIGPGFPDITPDWFKARGYALWKQSSVNEFWVHPSGKMIMKILDHPPAHPSSQISQPEDDPAELADLTLKMLRDTINMENDAMKKLIDRKSTLETTNKTTDDYRLQYEDYIKKLKEMKARLGKDIEAIEGLHTTLVEMKSPAAPEVDTNIGVLREIEIWAGIELTPMALQFIQPLNVKPIAPPADEDNDDEEEE